MEFKKKKKKLFMSLNRSIVAEIKQSLKNFCFHESKQKIRKRFFPNSCKTAISFCLWIKYEDPIIIS